MTNALATLPRQRRWSPAPDPAPLNPARNSGWQPDPSGPRVRLASSRCDWRQAEALLADYGVWIRATIGTELAVAQPAFARELTDLSTEYRLPRGAFLVADDGCAVCGIVAVRIHPDSSAELKRMYVRPAARGAGWAHRLVTAAIDWASGDGVERMWLETLPGPMDPAIALYRRYGFDEVPGTTTVDVDGVVVMERRIDL